MELSHADMPKGFYGYVYKITNLIDSRDYIGQHKLTNRNEPFLHYMGSSKDLKRDILRLNAENFKKEILEFAETGSDLASLERKYIRVYKAENKAEYNKSLWIGFIACSFCEIDFTSPASLRSHQVKEHGYSDKEVCSLCPDLISRGVLWLRIFAESIQKN